MKWEKVIPFIHPTLPFLAQENTQECWIGCHKSAALRCLLLPSVRPYEPQKGQMNCHFLVDP